ncbi:MAG: anhydro-N-acetylmuramic acid kinase, partial [Haliea sp.]
MLTHYIGLMSGTSLDGADGVLVDFSDGTLRVVASATEAFPAAFRAELLALNTSGPDELHRAALAANQLAALYAQVVRSLMVQGAAQGIAAAQIEAIGAHGQTVRHQPSPTPPAEAGYTLQLNNPARLAELTGLTVVADFRSRDVAAGGQGAPLAPAFHQGVFGQADATVCVLNLGGISNLSVLPPAGEGPVLGFDCGTGNALMDAWCQRHTGQAYDAGGAW